ncbi:MAG: cytochrome c1 [Alphaproteobacteria bacterium]|nr:cytochrome c1 [Alphaproteobacteria bacterium]
MRKTILAILVLGLSLPVAGVAAAASGGAELKKIEWSWQGAFGQYDRAELQRGLQVYKEVCAACHGLRLIAFRNLMDLGYTENQVKGFAKQYEVQNKEPNDEGEMFNRPGLPADRFVSPFPNEQAARAANGGAYPPDLSLIVKARAGGADYLYSLMVGYADAPAGVKPPAENLQYNLHFPGNWIAMPPPLSEGAVEYADGTKATADQMARDLTAFLAWAAMPELEQRKQMGLAVMMFLVVFTGLLIATKKKVWEKVDKA